MRSAQRPEQWMRDPALQAVEMGEEFVMMGLAQGEYYSVKGVAAAVWRHLAQPRDVGELCELVAAEYDVSAEACRDDIVAFLDELRGRRMVLAAS
ncbi:PqqD family protein [Nocardioides sp. LHD-245]|uniref:PqqD family protein n=1 Tax=Nocardioides sp. LHD-245 TaxID=3051387 RepID=UPI0027DF5206|nr:PqqD family protein [Nocardioides sp. LHD-245]